MTTEIQESARARELIDRLNLKHLNVESGLFSVIKVSDVMVEADDGPSPASNCIYLMLSKTYPQNFVQWLFSDDYQVLIEGGPADYYLFYEDGRSEKITMGRDLSKGQRMIVPSPGGTAKAIVLHEEAEYLLVGSILSPAWSPQRARIGADESFIETYTDSSDWATPEFLKYLVGPNFGHFVGADGEGLKITLDALGQIIWQDMQLTEKQFIIELENFTQEKKERALEVFIEEGAPMDLLDRISLLARQKGVHEIVINHKENP